MKFSNCLATLMAAGAIAFGSAQASAVVFTFDPDGTDATISPVTNTVELDWGVGNVLAKNSLQFPNGPLLAPGNEFVTYYQAKLNGLQLTTGPSGGVFGLGSDQEITIVAGFRERVTSLSADFEQASFEVVNDPTNFVRIFYDDGSGVNADNTTGLGFSDGTLILDGTIVSGKSTIDQSIGDPNKGPFNIVAMVDSLDSDFFPDLEEFGLINLQLINVGTIQDPNGVDPGVVFDTFDSTTTYVDNSTDFAFRADANTRISVVPEPVTATLGLVGLAGLGVALRRRRA